MYKKYKILYIDNISPVGHILFNRIQINSLIDLHCELYYAFQKGYAEKINIKNMYRFIDIPKFLYFDHTSKFIHRILNFFQLFLVYVKYLFCNFDAVIISCYDPVSLFFFSFKGKVFLFDHNNIMKLFNPVYRWFTKGLPKRYVHLVFNDHMKEGLEKYGITNIRLQEHEPVESYLSSINVKKYFNIPDSSKIIFSPSTISVDNNFIQDLILDKDFIDFLSSNNLILIIKGNYYTQSTNSPIICIGCFLDEPEYQSLFIYAEIILLPYKESFRYRVSGILFSAFENNKKIIASDVEGIRSYQYRFNYNPFFKNKEEVRERMTALLHLTETFQVYHQNLITIKQRGERVLS
jgi:hypothetical protein